MGRSPLQSHHPHVHSRRFWAWWSGWFGCRSSTTALARFRPSAINCGLSQAPDFQRRFHGFQPRQQRCPEDHGNHRAGLVLHHQPPAPWITSRSGWDFLHTPEFKIALWVKIICAMTMAAGTAAGGRRIIKTLGRKVARLQPPSGFAADTTSGSVLAGDGAAGHAGFHHPRGLHLHHGGRHGPPVSSNLSWHLVESILWTWVPDAPGRGLNGLRGDAPHARGSGASAPVSGNERISENRPPSRSNRCST